MHIKGDFVLKIFLWTDVDVQKLELHLGEKLCKCEVTDKEMLRGREVKLLENASVAGRACQEALSWGDEEPSRRMVMVTDEC